jgi:hypothetical protein
VLIGLMATCKALGAEPLAYLRDVLDRVSTHPQVRIGELLPDESRRLRAAADGAGPAE